MTTYYVDENGFLLSLNPIAGGIEVDAPTLKPPIIGNQLVNGQWILTNTIPPLYQQQENIYLENQINLKRKELLALSDWTQLPDVNISDKDAWTIYRQALRDIPEQPGYPTNVVWPVSPDGSLEIVLPPSKILM